MSDYVSRQYLLDEYDRQHQGPPGGARKIIAEAPAEDVAPVVHGRWIDDGTEFGCQCSECGKTLDDYVAPTEYASLNEIPNFCPNCGAKMEENNG